MVLLPGLAVVFVGIFGGGGDHGKLDKQVGAAVRELHVVHKQVAPATLRTIAKHQPGAADAVKKLHADGVVAFEVLGGHDLRIVTYEADGQLKTFLEVSITNGALAADDLDTLKSMLDSDVHAMRHEPDGDGVEIDPTPAPVPPPAPKPTPSLKPVAKAAPPPKAPPPLPPAPEPEPAPVTDSEHLAIPADPPGDAVSVDDVVNATAGAAADADTAPASSSTAPLHIGASAGLGVTGRLFAPGPSTVVGYSSTPVAMIHGEGHIEPTEHVWLAVLGEQTLGMSTPMQNGATSVSASTSMSRWEATAGYALPVGPVAVAPVVGLGRRAFAIDSTDPSRSPDSEYIYAIAGASIVAPLTSRIAVRGAAVFEPVFAGVEPAEMAFGDATRWAIAAGGAVEVQLAPHVFARGAADWQRFAWSWDMAGGRGAGGAVDNYFSGTVTVGAKY